MINGVLSQFLDINIAVDWKVEKDRKVGVGFASNSAEQSFTTNKTDLPSPSSLERNWECLV